VTYWTKVCARITKEEVIAPSLTSTDGTCEKNVQRRAGKLPLYDTMLSLVKLRRVQQLLMTLHLKATRCHLPPITM